MRSLLILSAGALAFALAQTTLIPTLGSLTRELHTDASGIAWVLTAYLISAAVATPVMGRLGDMFGKRRLFVISLLIFAGGNVVSALGSTLEIVVAGRVLQGIGGGIFPLAIGIVRDEFPHERVPGSIGLLSALAGIGGGLGLIAGGLLSDHLSYHWIFWLAAALAGLAALAAAVFVPESPIRTPGRVDLRGAVVLAAGLVPPLVAISRANDWGWGSTRTLVLIAVGLVVLAVWVAVERRTEQPLADIPTLIKPPVLLTNIATLFVGFGMFGSFLLIPQLAELPESTGFGFGLGATGAGLLLLPGAVMMLFTGPISGALGTRFGSKLPLAIGAAMTSAGLVGLGLNHGSEVAVVAWSFVMSSGIGLSFAAMANLIVEAVPPEQTGEATGINALTRSVGASIGSQVSAAILAGSAVAGSALPTDDGFTAAFLVSAGVAAVAAGIAVVIPRGEHQAIRSHVPAAMAER
jgi:EmrB/QacA subfamily drug resistance transporter